MSGKKIIEGLREAVEHAKGLPGWWPLKAAGYAPGNYWCKCIRCEQRFEGDKRAWRCRPCAEELLKNTPPDEEAMPL